jgi:hypothetical protein
MDRKENIFLPNRRFIVPLPFFKMTSGSEANLSTNTTNLTTSAYFDEFNQVPIGREFLDLIFNPD